MAEGSDFVEAGALASYATDDAENFKRAGRIYVDKILKGTRARRSTGGTAEEV